MGITLGTSASGKFHHLAYLVRPVHVAIAKLGTRPERRCLSLPTRLVTGSQRKATASSLSRCPLGGLAAAETLPLGPR
jgi:hypothetical protein